MQQQHQILLMKKKNTKWKKYEITENKDATYNSWYIRKNMGMNMISGYLKQDYHMLGR